VGGVVAVDLVADVAQEKESVIGMGEESRGGTGLGARAERVRAFRLPFPFPLTLRRKSEEFAHALCSVTC
jgi:hypothetical protein